MDGASITLTGAWAIFAIIIFIIIGSIGVAGLLFVAYRIWHFTIKQLLICLKIDDAFRAFMIERISERIREKRQKSMPKIKEN